MDMDRNRHIDIMGIVNVNDDSFFAGSRCPGAADALSRIGNMLDEGATIIDIGACSTRPGSFPVGADVEWMRLEPVLREVVSSFPGIRLSIDTYWTEVVEKAYDLVGPFIVNDISAGENDPAMLDIVGRLNLEYIAMHRIGDHMSMHMLTDFKDITSDVIAYFEEFAVNAEKSDVKKWILDPGFGFGKTIEQNYKLLSGLHLLKRHFSSSANYSIHSGIAPKILVGISRKSMIYRYLDVAPEDSLPATQVLHLAALQNGADILRVHDVAEASRTLSLYRIL